MSKRDLKNRFTKEVESIKLDFHNFEETPELVAKLDGTKILNIDGEAVEFLTAADMETGETIILPRNVDLMRKIENLAVGTEMFIQYIGKTKIDGTKKSIKRFRVCLSE